MIQFYNPQTHRWQNEPIRDEKYYYNVSTETWDEIPDRGEEPTICRVPQKKERHWLVTAIPLWLLVIAIFAFLVWERHLIAYVDGKKVIDISYTLFESKLNNIILYDQNENQAAKLTGHFDWGSKKLIYTQSGPNEDTYMECYYINGILAARIEHYGNDLRSIFYSSDGLIESLEETINGVTYVYTFNQNAGEKRDENQIYNPEYLTNRHSLDARTEDYI